MQLRKTNQGMQTGASAQLNPTMWVLESDGLKITSDTEIG
jgi:hypothetical protein